MKRGRPRKTSRERKMSKSVLRRVRIKKSGLIICKQRMRNHCMLNRTSRTPRNNALYGSEAKVVRIALGLSNKRERKSTSGCNYYTVNTQEAAI